MGAGRSRPFKRFLVEFSRFASLLLSPFSRSVPAFPSSSSFSTGFGNPTIAFPFGPLGPDLRACFLERDPFPARTGVDEDDGRRPVGEPEDAEVERDGDREGVDEREGEIEGGSSSEVREEGVAWKEACRSNVIGTATGRVGAGEDIGTTCSGDEEETGLRGRYGKSRGEVWTDAVAVGGGSDEEEGAGFEGFAVDSGWCSRDTSKPFVEVGVT